MSFLLAPALRRLFPAVSARPPAPETVDMDLQPQDVCPDAIDPGALTAAVDLHESVNAMERSSYEARLRGAMDDLLNRLDTKRNG